MRVLILSLLTTILSVQGNTSPYNCDGPGNWTRFFSKFQIPPNSDVVVGGYLPNITAGWYCKTDMVTHSGVHGVFLRYNSHKQGFLVGVSQQVFDSNKYQLYLYRDNQNTYTTAQLRICKWSQQVNLTSPSGPSKARDCLFDKKIPLVLQDRQNIVIGMTWVGDRLTVFAKKILVFNLPNANWSLVASKCFHTSSCAMQFPSQQIFYRLNVSAEGLVTPTLCVSTDCHDLATNVFAVQDGGLIPPSFSFNNWFVLTNSSTLISGTIVSTQPMLLSCLWAVPKFQGTGKTVWFNSTAADCNGYSSNASFDVLRFNLNGTASPFNGNRSSGVHLYTSFGPVHISCSNETRYNPNGSIPFGMLDRTYYCFAQFNFSGRTSKHFVGVLPSNLREIVVARTGQIYINGYNYFQVPDVLGVYFDIVSDDVSGFWTIAFASWTTVMLDINGTNIQRMLYCNTPENTLRCSQLSFDLSDGFYPITQLQSELHQEPPVAFVTLPAFKNHAYLNVSVNASWNEQTYPPTLSQVNVSINDVHTFCVQTSQFTTKVLLNVSSNYGHTAHSYDGDCPFHFGSLNNYLSFGKLCISTQSIDSRCAIKLFLYPAGNGPGFLATTFYFSYMDGEFITGTPQPLEGVTDASFFTTGVCSRYTIYGIKGDGVINLANDSLLTGLYYTSSSGQLLAFKNVTTGQIYSVTPCQFSQQAAFVDGRIVGVLSSSANTTFNNTVQAPSFYYHSNTNDSCADPVLVYSNFGVCKDGAITYVEPKESQPRVVPMFVGNISIPMNFTMGVRTEYIQLYNNPISIDCSMYVCNGNERCNKLLNQYASACKTIESALQMSARLESMEVNSMLTLSQDALQLANISIFNGGGYNFTNFLATNEPAGTSASYSRRSRIEDLLFDKVVTNGLGTVDEDYKRCSNGLSIADLVCAQYYKGIMVLPGVVDAEKLHMYSASLVGSMVFGGFTAAAALPFSYAVQARLNYVALQTDVLQRNQQILAESFNSAIGNITLAFESVNDAITQTSQGLWTVADALSKVQDVVNKQGNALNHLTMQLRNNFQAISSSIDDIYGRLDELAADAQVDRLINGRLAALNAFVSQSLTKFTEVQASRKLAQQKVNECVKSQSNRFGFCGDDGEHIFSIVQAAPMGLMFFHTVLLPGAFAEVTAIAGLCVDNTMAMAVRDSGLVLFTYGDMNKFFISSRKMFEPRTPQVTDFVQIESCPVIYHNLTADSLPEIVPDYIDVNKTLEDIISSLPNKTTPDLLIDIFNVTYLNLTGEIADLEQRSESLRNTTEELRSFIYNINNTLVDLEWLNRVETYIKWPWWVWLIIFIVLIFAVSLLVFCCISTGCCGCCGCCGACFSGCCRGPRLQPYEAFEKVHVQ
uniref:Spike protein n=1 Tax=Porcine epidemic diarrhea virus TaxID=28295 RepID=A0A286R3Q7_PEDV|nr:spike protein [Porcine epidemic diarrhea virus]